MSGADIPCSKRGNNDLQHALAHTVKLIVQPFTANLTDGASNDTEFTCVEKESCNTMLNQSNPMILTFNVVDPERHVKFPAPPPKLHYTTWWRKVTKRLYQRQYPDKLRAHSLCLQPRSNKEY